MRCWRGYLTAASYKRLAYSLADATATPSSLASIKIYKIKIGLTCLVLAYHGCSGKQAIKREFDEF